MLFSCSQKTLQKERNHTLSQCQCRKQRSKQSLPLTLSNGSHDVWFRWNPILLSVGRIPWLFIFFFLNPYHSLPLSVFPLTSLSSQTHKGTFFPSGGKYCTLQSRKKKAMGVIVMPGLLLASLFWVPDSVQPSPSWWRLIPPPSNLFSVLLYMDFPPSKEC